MDKQVMIEKLQAVDCVSGDAELQDVISALQSSVLLSKDEAVALLNDDGNDNQSAVDEIESQLATIEKEKKNDTCKDRG